MLTEQQIEVNKQQFISAINLLSRVFDKDALIKMLCETDFFTAPASTKYHSSYKGGLCQHSLNVWRRLLDLDILAKTELDVDSMAIVGLCHDFAKINFYKQAIKNEKVYSETGSKSDNMGRFDWVAKTIYTVKPADERFVYGNHEITSEMITRSYIPLSYDESIAILHHHAGMSADCAQNNITEIYAKNPLALLLHQADMIATYLDEA